MHRQVALANNQVDQRMAAAPDVTDRTLQLREKRRYG
jgi:hypothetical protein